MCELSQQCRANKHPWGRPNRHKKSSNIFQNKPPQNQTEARPLVDPGTQDSDKRKNKKRCICIYIYIYLFIYTRIFLIKVHRGRGQNFPIWIPCGYLVKLGPWQLGLYIRQTLRCFESRFAVRSDTNRHRFAVISNRKIRIARPETVRIVLRLTTVHTAKDFLNDSFRVWIGIFLPELINRNYLSVIFFHCKQLKLIGRITRK